MKSYEIWLTNSSSSIVGTMSEADAKRIFDEIKKGTLKPIVYEDGDGDTTVIQTAQIAVFAFRDDTGKKEVGFCGRHTQR